MPVPPPLPSSPPAPFPRRARPFPPKDDVLPHSRKRHFIVLWRISYPPPRSRFILVPRRSPIPSMRAQGPSLSLAPLKYRLASPAPAYSSSDPPPDLRQPADRLFSVLLDLIAAALSPERYVRCFDSLTPRSSRQLTLPRMFASPCPSLRHCLLFLQRCMPPQPCGFSSSSLICLRPG